MYNYKFSGLELYNLTSMVPSQANLMLSKDYEHEKYNKASEDEDEIKITRNDIAAVAALTEYIVVQQEFSKYSVHIIETLTHYKNIFQMLFKSVWLIYQNNKEGGRDLQVTINKDLIEER
jgi:hypothetical protein